MSEASSLLDCLSEDALWRLEEICCRFEKAWLAGNRLRPEDCLTNLEGAERLAVLRELLRLDVHYRRKAGEEVRPEEYGTRFPDASTILSEIFHRESVAIQNTTDASREPGQEHSLQTVDEVALGGNGVVPSSDVPNSAGTGSSRYQRLRFHAKGNLGEVYVAEDQELHREVALKEIQSQHAHREDRRGRFVLEAEVTGRLEHPGIVPVYGLGMYSDGRPYYAMRFIRGHTLEDALSQFHGQAPMRFTSLEFRQLLGRFVAVCQAVAYAHGQGVLHRDLKPANIMLGEFGETIVVDWGLAKVMDRPETREQSPSEEGKLRRSKGGGLETAAGSVVGTPAFMSPEQAAGKLAELTPATDVYGLGATLYALLTGKAAFQGPLLEVVKKVARGEWLPARRVNSAVPPTLEAICGKAMALRPEERYPSALALAKDLEYWLADEPVRAYAEPAGARLRRWLRKRPRRVTAAVVLLVAAVVGLTVGTVLLERSNREARENLALAEGQADYLVEEVSEDLLMSEPGMQPLRQRLLMKVLDDYARFLNNRPGNPHARQQLAKTKRQLGELYLQAGWLAEATAKADQAVAEYEQLHQAAPADRGLRFGLARARHLRADLEAQVGDSVEGKREVDQLLVLLEGLKAEEPGNVDYLLLLARGYDLRAMLAAQQTDPAAGLADNQRVLECLEESGISLRFVSGDPRVQRKRRQANIYMSHFSGPLNASFYWENSWQDVLMLGRACINRGVLLSRAGRNAEAAQVLEEAIAAHQILLEGNSRTGPFRHGLALALLHSGRVQVELGRPGKAEPALREALRLMQQLSRDDPHVQQYRATRLLAAGYLGEALVHQGRTTAAAELLREAEQQGEEVFGSSRQDLGLRGQHAHLLLVLGCLEGETGHLDRGLELCRKAQDELADALRQTPGDPSVRSDWLASREALARYRFQEGSLSRAGWIAEQQALLQERTGLARHGPTASRFQGEVAASAVILTGLLLEADRSAEALACVAEVLPAYEQVVRAEQDRVRAAAKEQQAAAQTPFTPDRHNALELALRSRSIFLDNSLHRRWAALLACRGTALARRGRDEEAVAVVRQALAINANLLWTDRPFQAPPTFEAALWAFLPTLLWPLESCDLYDLARHQALAATLPGENGTPDPAAQAVQALRWCVAAGFDNLQQLRTDPALEPLRKRDDFQKLVHDLEARSLERKDALRNP